MNRCHSLLRLKILRIRVIQSGLQSCNHNSNYEYYSIVERMMDDLKERVFFSVVVRASNAVECACI